MHTPVNDQITKIAVICQNRTIDVQKLQPPLLLPPTDSLFSPQPKFNSKSRQIKRPEGLGICLAAEEALATKVIKCVE